MSMHIEVNVEFFGSRTIRESSTIFNCINPVLHKIEENKYEKMTYFTSFNFTIPYGR